MSTEAPLTLDQARAIFNRQDLTSPIAVIFRDNFDPIRQAVKETSPEAPTSEIFLEVADQIEKLYPTLEHPLSQSELLEIAKETRGFYDSAHRVGKILAVTFASSGRVAGLPRLWLAEGNLPNLDLETLRQLDARLMELENKKHTLDQIIPANKPEDLTFEELVQKLKKLSALDSSEYNPAEGQRLVNSLHQSSDPLALLLTEFSQDEFGNGIQALGNQVTEQIKRLDPQDKKHFRKRMTLTRRRGLVYTDPSA